MVLTYIAALPLTERMINEDPHVRASIMFGRGKFQNGHLVEPSGDFVIDPTDLKKVEEYRNKIWYVPNCTCASSSVADTVMR